jgi:hypothetical protein
MRVVSASEDGTLRVWQVPLDATSADDITPPRVLRAGSAVLSLATNADASTAFLGKALGRSERLQVWDLEFGVAVASLEGAPIDYWPIPLCSSLVDNGGEGTDRTLFVGYNNGTVAKWSVATRTCTAVRVKGVGLRAGVRAVAARVEAGNARSGGDGDDGVELVTGQRVCARVQRGRPRRWRGRRGCWCRSRANIGRGERRCLNGRSV